MRKATTTITPMLLKSRSKGDTFSVVIRINHEGRYYFSMGFYAKESDWDDKSHRLKKKYPNSEVLNKLIADKVYSIEQRLYSFIQSNTPFTAKMLCEENTVTASSCVIDDLLKSMSNERNLRPATQRNHQKIYSRVKKWIRKDKVLITELSAATLRKFADWMQYEEKLKISVIRGTLGVIGTIWKYAIQKKVASADNYPFNEWRYLYDFKATPTHKALTLHQIDELVGYFVSHYLAVDIVDNSYSYKNYENHLKIGCTELYLSLFLIGYHMQGIALADLLSIKMNQIRFVTREDTEYMVVEGLRRQKTGIPFQMVVEMTDTFNALIRVFLSTAEERDGWLFPIYSEFKFDRLTDAIVTDKRHNVINSISRHLKKVAEELKWEDTKLTYYMCRHSFATHYLEKTNGNVLALASMLGHNPLQTETYIKELTSVDAIISAKKGMF